MKREKRQRTKERTKERKRKRKRKREREKEREKRGMKMGNDKANAGERDAEVVEQGKQLVCDLCHGFYSLGWVSGTGGSISIKVSDDRIVMAPSGVQKERMKEEVSEEKMLASKKSCAIVIFEHGYGWVLL